LLAQYRLNAQLVPRRIPRVNPNREISLQDNHLPEKDTKLQQTCEQDTLAAPVFPGFFTY